MSLGTRATCIYKYIYIYIYNPACAAGAGKASINMKVMEAKLKIIDSSNCGGSGSSGGSL
jgi:uncharacterized membrane protein